VLLVVVITLATLLITAAPPAATFSSEGGANLGENYGHDVVPPNDHYPSAHRGL
jgi:hypothetical protein